MRDQRTAFILCVTLLLLFLGDAAAQTSRINSAKSYVKRGNSRLERGEIERAIGDFDLAITFHARMAATCFNRGVAWQRKGDEAGEE